MQYKTWKLGIRPGILKYIGIYNHIGQRLLLALPFSRDYIFVQAVYLMHRCL